MISGTTEVPINQIYHVKMLIDLPFRQFIRVEYETETDSKTENPFSQNLVNSKTIYHETISSGTLSIFTFRPKQVGTVYIRIKKLFLSNYQQILQEMPDLFLKTHVIEKLAE